MREIHKAIIEDFECSIAKPHKEYRQRKTEHIPGGAAWLITKN